MADIRHEILKYLSDNDTGQHVPLNSKLKELLGGQPVKILKGILTDIVGDKAAELSGNYRWMGATHGSEEQNLDNQQIGGRILPAGQKELADHNKQQNETKLTAAQLGDIPKNARDRNKNIIIGVLLLIVAILTLIVTTKCKT